MGKPVPKFWWDFAGDSAEAVIVQSDWVGGEELACFKRPPHQPKNAGLEPQIAQAEQLIADYKAGRKTPSWGLKNGSTE